MKLNKINYSICCDMPDCSGLSSYSLTFGIQGTDFHICESCILKLKKEIKRMGV